MPIFITRYSSAALSSLASRRRRRPSVVSHQLGVRIIFFEACSAFTLIALALKLCPQSSSLIALTFREIFERYQRSEKALVAALTQMYIQGVSRTLSGAPFSRRAKLSLGFCVCIL
jgi:hypothetical protein